MTAATSQQQEFQPGAMRAFCPTCNRDHGAYIRIPGGVFQCQHCGTRQNGDAMESQRDKELAEQAARRSIARQRGNPPSNNDSLDIITARIHTELAAVRDHGKQMVVHIIQAGKGLVRARTLVKHGEWGKWLDQNFALSEETARNFIHVAEFQARHPDIDLTPAAPTVLYYFARTSVPIPAVQEFIKLLEAGNPVTSATVSTLIKHSAADEKIVTESAPATVRAAVEGGELSIRKAATITKAYLAAPTPVQEVVKTYGVTDPELVPALVQLHQRGSESFAEIAATGAIQSSAETVPLEAATIRDLNAMLAEKAYFHRVGNAPDFLVDVQARIVSAEAGRLILTASDEEIRHIAAILNRTDGGLFARLTIKGESSS